MIRVFAHRGFSGSYPENTMLAFKQALANGAGGIELDVQLTKDGEVIILHDEKLDRTTTGTGLVSEHSLEDLRQLDASYTYRGMVGFNPIPTLREYFEQVKQEDIITNIELKTGILPYPGIEQKTWELIREFHLEDRIIISSFNHYSIMRMKSIAPCLEYGLLTSTWIYQPGAYAKQLGVTCYHPHYIGLTDEVIQDLKEHNIKINPWTVNSKEDAANLIAKGVDNIISNYPDILGK